MKYFSNAERANMFIFNKKLFFKASFIFICCQCLMHTKIYSETVVEKNLTTSVIIPCYWGHFKYLEELLDLLTKQTILPNEVIISLSEINKITQQQLTDFEIKKYPFEVKIVKHDEKILAGGNRNSACEHASGDILILNDADDLPHVQRIELIKNVFENSNAQMVMHLFAQKNFDIFEKYDLSAVGWHKLDTLPCPWFPGKWHQVSFPRYHNGNIAITRKMFEESNIRWETSHMIGEDCEFNQHVFNRVGFIYVIDAKLIMYRAQLGTSNPIHSKN